jgi:hypothetical protein
MKALSGKYVFLSLLVLALGLGLLVATTGGHRGPPHLNFL